MHPYHKKNLHFLESYNAAKKKKKKKSKKNKINRKERKQGRLFTWSCIIQVYHFLLKFIGSISPGASSISGTSVLVSNSPNPDQSPPLPEIHHSTTSLSPPVVNSLSIGAASDPPVGLATSESLQEISVEGKGKFSFYQS